MSGVREQLAQYAHEAWSGWMRYLFGKCSWRDLGDDPNDTYLIMPTVLYERWQRQMNTAYADLAETEKDSDRIEADRMLEIANSEQTATIGRLEKELEELRQKHNALMVANRLRAEKEQTNRGLPPLPKAGEVRYGYEVTDGEGE